MAMVIGAINHKCHRSFFQNSFSQHIDALCIYDTEFQLPYSIWGRDMRETTSKNGKNLIKNCYGVQKSLNLEGRYVWKKPKNKKIHLKYLCFKAVRGWIGSKKLKSPRGASKTTVECTESGRNIEWLTTCNYWYLSDPKIDFQYIVGLVRVCHFMCECWFRL